MTRHEMETASGDRLIHTPGRLTHRPHPRVMGRSFDRLA
jgi:hypothetical protein